MTESLPSMDPRSRLRDAIQRSGLTIDEVASNSNMTKPGIYDLLAYQDEWELALSLKDLRILSGVLAVSPIWLVDGTDESVEKKDDGWLYEQVLKCLEQNGCSLLQFEDTVGYALKDGSSSWTPSDEFNVDLLKSLASALHVDWRALI